MSETEMNKRVQEAFAGEMTPKFLATVSTDGVPNIVPIISMEAWDAATLIFGELMIWKTKKNLEAWPKCGAAVLTADMNCWTIRGDFEGFQRTGEKHDKLNMKDMFRYNAYTGLRSAGSVAVKDVNRIRGMMATGRVMEMLTAASLTMGIKHSNNGPMPPQVTEKFATMKAAKFISYVDADGYPVALPAISLFPSGHGRLEAGVGCFRVGDNLPPEPPFKIAACVITFAPVAYQIKGTVTSYKSRMGIKTAVIDVDEVYSASPPLPGKQINREYKQSG